MDNLNKNNWTPVQTWASAFSQRFDLSNTEQVLDLGCREGLMTHQLARSYPQQQFVALDTNETVVLKAKTLPSLANLSFEHHDSEQLDFNAKFDAVVSFSHLHWIDDKRNLLSQIYNALKPGGKTYLQFFAQHGRPKNDRFLFHTAAMSPWKAYFKQFTPDYSDVNLGFFAALLKAVGFNVNRLEFKRYRTLFEHPEHLQSWLGTWASHTKRIPFRKHKTFLAETVTTYLQAYQYSVQNSFPYYEYLLEVECEKPLTAEVEDENATRCFGLYFTPKEQAALRHYLKGLASKEIAIELAISAKTVEFHIANVKEKLRCHRRSEIFQAAWRYGFIDLIFQ